MSGYPSSGDTINQITRVRLPDGTDVAIVDWSWRPLYSTLDILAGATDQQMYMFNYAQGDNVSASSNITAAQLRTATDTDCNNSQAGEMDAVEEYLVYAMAVEAYQFSFESAAYNIDGPGLPMIRAGNLALLHAKTILELEVSQKDYFKASVGWFAAGFGVNAVGVGTPAANAIVTYATNGTPNRNAIDRAPVPVHIGGTEKYRVILHNKGQGIGSNALDFRSDTAGASDTDALVRLRCNFVGLHKRPAG
jgi:hypothetical protein